MAYCGPQIKEGAGDTKAAEGLVRTLGTRRVRVLDQSPAGAFVPSCVCYDKTAGVSVNISTTCLRFWENRITEMCGGSPEWCLEEKRGTDEIN